MNTIVGISTTGERHRYLERTIKSLDGQVDEINILYNSLSNSEDVEAHVDTGRNVHRYFYPGDLSDNGKFYFLTLCKEPVYYFTCDDKIIYPDNYIETMKAAIEQHKCIITAHGRKLVDCNSFYRGSHKAYHFLNDVNADVRVDVPGTGVMGFRTDYFNPDEIHLSEYKQMSDLVFALEAKRAGKKIICIKHTKNWLKSVYLRDSISVRMSKKGADESKQVELMKLILNER